MKIVKFENGKFAVRRWTLFGYEYLDEGSLPGRQDCWWPIHTQNESYVATKEQAEKLLADYYERKRKPRYDRGTPVS